MTKECLEHGSIYNTSIKLGTDNKYSRHDINAKFNQPLFLYSEGGSGNTWMRILMEYITGISTGVPFADDLFMKIFNAEGECHAGLLLCKQHPRWFYYSGIIHFEYFPQGIWKWPDRNISAQSTADGLVWIVRNPWYSMWSLHQLVASKFSSHGYRIPKEQFNAYDWKNELYFGTTELSLVEHWKKQFELVDILKQNRSWNDDNIVIIKYEMLLDTETRVDEILKVVKHLYHLEKDDIWLDDHHYFVAATKYGLKYLTYEELLIRIECAFEYTDNMHVEHVKRDKYTDKHAYISMDDAYLSVGINTICNIWNSVRPYAQLFGYKQLFLHKFDCDKLNMSYYIVDNINNPNWTHIRQMQKEKRERNERIRIQQKLRSNNSFNHSFQ